MSKAGSLLLSLFAAGVTAAGNAAAASFDCAKAQSRVEKAICADAELSALDEHMGRYYAAARTTLREAADCLPADQRQWLRVRNGCADAACLKKTYLERLAELDALQPGASAIRNIELPRVPTLVWIIPALQEQAGAPPKPAAKPLVAQGRIVDDIAGGGDGFLLRTPGGASHLLVTLMFLDGGTADRLPVLAKENATFSARGYAADDGRGKIYYEPSRCVFLYRLP